MPLSKEKQAEYMREYRKRRSNSLGITLYLSL